MPAGEKVESGADPDGNRHSGLFEVPCDPAFLFRGTEGETEDVRLGISDTLEELFVRRRLDQLFVAEVRRRERPHDLHSGSVGFEYFGHSLRDSFRAPGEKDAPVLLDTPQTAQVLRLQPTTLEARRSRGTGPPFIRLGPSTIRYRLRDLEAWLDECTARSTAEEPAEGTVEEYLENRTCPECNGDLMPGDGIGGTPGRPHRPSG